MKFDFPQIYLVELKIDVLVYKFFYVIVLRIEKSNTINE